jgi:hypothetical protein
MQITTYPATVFDFICCRFGLKKAIEPIVSGIRSIRYVYFLRFRPLSHVASADVTTGPDNSLFAIDG